MNRMDLGSHRATRLILPALVVLALVALAAPALAAGDAGEAGLRVPDLGRGAFGGGNGRALLMWGLLVGGLGLVFGVGIFVHLQNLPAHQPMRGISEPVPQ